MLHHILFSYLITLDLHLSFITVLQRQAAVLLRLDWLPVRHITCVSWQIMACTQVLGLQQLRQLRLFTHLRHLLYRQVPRIIPLLQRLIAFVQLEQPLHTNGTLMVVRG